MLSRDWGQKGNFFGRAAPHQGVAAAGSLRRGIGFHPKRCGWKPQPPADPTG
jgi:hypothetical protein